MRASLGIDGNYDDSTPEEVFRRILSRKKENTGFVLYLFCKRIIDIVVSFVVLVLFIPLMLLIALVIRIDSSGPVIFKQSRVGQNRRGRKPDFGVELDQKGTESIERRLGDLNGGPFAFYKFRTMYTDARERFPELYNYDFSEEEIEMMRFKLIDDPRLTRVGAFLRKHTLDEIPNFLNVLLGNMSLVGPRPDIPQMMRYYKPWQRAKFLVKPGITGLAQANGRGLLTFQATLRKDVRYVENQSFLLDVRIGFATIRAIIFRYGAF